MEDAQVLALQAVLRRAAMRHRSRAADLLAEHGLALGQEQTLFALAEHGACSQVQLGREAGTEPPTVSANVRKLEAAGLVRREQDPDDARARRITLTPLGETTVTALRTGWLALGHQLVSGLSNDTAEVLLAGLREIADSLGPDLAAGACEGPGAQRCGGADG